MVMEITAGAECCGPAAEGSQEIPACYSRIVGVILVIHHFACPIQDASFN